MYKQSWKKSLSKTDLELLFQFKEKRGLHVHRNPYFYELKVKVGSWAVKNTGQYPFGGPLSVEIAKKRKNNI